MVLGRLSVPGRPTDLYYSRTKAYFDFSRYGWGLFGYFFSFANFSFLSASFWETGRNILEYCLKGSLKPKQPTSLGRVAKWLALKTSGLEVIKQFMFSSAEHKILSGK